MSADPVRMTGRSPLVVRRVLGRRPTGEQVLVVTVLVVAAVAWAVLVAGHEGGPAGGHGAPGGHTPGRVDDGAPVPGTQVPSIPTGTVGEAGHHGAGEVRLPTDGASSPVVPWLLGWVLMVVAMMLPPALPLLRTMRRVGVRVGRPLRVVGATTAAFVGVWVAAGVGLLAGGGALGGLLDRSVWLAAHPAGPSGLAAVAVGAYQLSPLRRACLTACRSPAAVLLTTWSGTRPAVTEAAHTGLRYGAVCVGCCWALMALTLTVGAAALPLMVLAGVVMALERLAPPLR
ncbi:MAG: DUF2182 domain-containing protein, partial [Phycicoccus sp.]